MLYLPLPEPWTIETLPQYIDQLVGFVDKYGDIARYRTHDVFTKGLPVTWVPEFGLQDWVDIVRAQCDGPFCEPFSGFVSLSQRLPLVDNRPPLEIPVKNTHQGMSPKKCHEVDSMVAFVAEMTKARQVTAKSIIDVGSGLGYLSTALSKAGYQVSGVEGDEARATKAAEKNSFRSIHKMVETYTDLDIVEDSCCSLSLRTPSFHVFF